MLVTFIKQRIDAGVGAEVQRSLATVVIGGILSNTLLVLPVRPLQDVSVFTWPKDGA
ncbi:MAG: hypothetical protein V1929_00990 [bacterium]